MCFFDNFFFEAFYRRFWFGAALQWVRIKMGESMTFSASGKARGIVRSNNISRVLWCVPERYVIRYH